MHHYRHSQNIPSRFASNTRIRAEEFRRQPLTLMKTYKLGCLLLVALALISGAADERFLERNGFGWRDICLHLLLLFLATSLTAMRTIGKPVLPVVFRLQIPGRHPLHNGASPEVGRETSKCRVIECFIEPE